MLVLPQINLQQSPDWKSYQLLDCGDGRKLEKFGPYTLIRPEAEAIWQYFESGSLAKGKW